MALIMATVLCSRLHTFESNSSECEYGDLIPAILETVHEHYDVLWMHIILVLYTTFISFPLNPGDQGEIGEKGDQGKLGKNGPPGLPGIQHPSIYPHDGGKCLGIF